MYLPESDYFMYSLELGYFMTEEGGGKIYFPIRAFKRRPGFSTGSSLVPVTAIRKYSKQVLVFLFAFYSHEFYLANNHLVFFFCFFWGGLCIFFCIQIEPEYCAIPVILQLVISLDHYNSALSYWNWLKSSL